MQHAGKQALLGSTIPAPLMLYLAASVPVQCVADLASGSLEVFSAATAAAGARQSVHLRTAAVQVSTRQFAPQGKGNPVTPVAAVLAGSLPTAKQQHVAATASLAVKAAVHGSGYLAHPALMDSCLHMGARLADALQQESALQSQAWVPVAIGAFCPSDALASTAAAWAGAQITGKLPDGSATSSYCLMGGSSGRALLELAELQAKPARRALEAQANKAAAPRLLYSIQWQTSEPLAGLMAQQARRTRASQSIRKSLKQSRRSRAAGAAAASCLEDITNVQRAMTAHSEADVFSLGTRGVQSQDIAGSVSRRVGVPEGAAAWGLVRVAASEQPEMRWAAADAVSALPTRQAAVPGHDAFGTVLDAGRAAVPRILGEDREAAATLTGTYTGSNGRVIITGGLGGNHCAQSQNVTLFQLLSFSVALKSMCKIAWSVLGQNVGCVQEWGHWLELGWRPNPVGRSLWWAAPAGCRLLTPRPSCRLLVLLTWRALR